MLRDGRSALSDFQPPPLHRGSELLGRASTPRIAYPPAAFHFAVSLGWGAMGENPHSRAIFECFKLRGLFLRPDAADVVAAQLRREPNPDAALRVIASKIEDDRRSGGGVSVGASFPGCCCAPHALPVQPPSRIRLLAPMLFVRH